MLEVRRDNVVGSLVMGIHKRWGVTPAEQRLFHDGLLLPHNMSLRYLDNSDTVQTRSPVVIKMTSDTYDDYEIEVLPGDNVEPVMYEVQRRWGVGPYLLMVGRSHKMPIWNLYAKGRRFLSQGKGGGGKKSSARRAAMEQSRKLEYKVAKKSKEEAARMPWRVVRQRGDQASWNTKKPRESWQYGPVKTKTCHSACMSKKWKEGQT